MGNFKGAHRYLTSIWVFKFRMCKILYQSYTGRKHRSFKIISMQVFEIMDEANLDTENKRVLNLASVGRRTFEVTILSL
jgi:hypothetical protein